MIFRRLCIFIVVIILFLSAGTLFSGEQVFKPFIMGSNFSGNMTIVKSEVINKLENQGFEIIGEYSPYTDAYVIIITNNILKNIAAGSEHGGFGAMQRVSLTKINNSIQVSYTNPTYMFYAYRMKGNIESISSSLEQALGVQNKFGSDKGLSEKKLSKYQYKVLMPRFNNVITIAKYKSYNEAIIAVESGLAAGNGGTSKVYRIDIPGKEETVFGVALTTMDNAGSDFTVMEEIDFKSIRSTAHLPYEILVTGKKVIIFDGKFRIAINFPDLSMMGDHSFMNIVGAPGDIEKSLKAAALGK